MAQYARPDAMPERFVFYFVFGSWHCAPPAVTPAMACNDATLSVLVPFEAFQIARLDFAQELARLASQGHPSGGPAPVHEVDGAEKVLAALEASDTLAMDIAALVTDLAPSVQQSAMIAMGRMCGLSAALCVKVASPDLLRHVVGVIGQAASAPLLKAALFLLHASALSSAEVAGELVELGALPLLCERVEALDPSAKADAVWCLAAIAAHDAQLAKAVGSSGALPLLKLCLKEASLPLRRVTLSCLGSIGMHDPDLASTLAKDGILTDMIQMLLHRDLLLRRHACRALAVSVQHLTDLSFWKPEATANTLACLGPACAADSETAAFAAALIGQLCKQSRSLAGACHEAGAAPMLARLLHGSKAPVPVAMALGHLCAALPPAAAAAASAGAVDNLLSLLSARPAPHVCAALASCLGSIGGAGPEGAAALASSGALLAMARSTLLSRRKLSRTTAAVSRVALVAGLSRCTDYPTLVALFEEMRTPPAGPADPLAEGASLDDAGVYGALLRALASAFAENGNHRHDFMSRGHLAHAQLAAGSGPAAAEGLAKLNAAFPAQMVKAAQHSDYEGHLLSQLVDK